VTDPVSQAVDDYIRQHGRAVVAAALRQALGETGRISQHGPDRWAPDLQSAKLDANKLLGLLADLCKKHSFGRLLLLYRKIPYELAVSLFASRVGYESVHDLGMLMEQATLFGTNCILRYSPKDDGFAEYNDRYKFTPTELELQAALELAVYTLAHRHMMFYANTAARRPLCEAVSFNALIGSYNKRQQKRHRYRLVPATSSDRVLVVPSFVFHLPPATRLLEFELADGDARTIAHRNHVPVPMDFDKATRPFAYLETDLFHTTWGMSFHSWKRIWCALNAVLRDNLLTLWPPLSAAVADPSFAAAAAERADDYSDTALGGGSKESIVDACHMILETRHGEASIAPADVNRFVDGLTVQTLIGDISFVEQPCLFYEMGPGLVFWDYLRHGGILRAVAREIASKQQVSQVGDTSGHAFEDFIRNRVAEAGLSVRDIRTNVTIRRRGRQVWEIDVGFVFGRVLVLLEAKYSFKGIKYHSAHGPTVSGRIQSWETWCEQLDTKLHRYTDDVRHQWPNPTLIGAICIVCTEETEFIASAERKYWLSLPDYPRVCTIDELLECLGEHGEEAIVSHPSFMSFKA
jgi:hypothetical protein